MPAELQLHAANIAPVNLATTHPKHAVAATCIHVSQDNALDSACTTRACLQRVRGNSACTVQRTAEQRHACSNCYP